MVFSKYEQPRGTRSQRQKHKQPLPTPEFTSISVKSETFERLKLYGSYEDSFDIILNKICDVVDGKRKRQSIIRAKEWYRDSTFGKQILGSNDNG
jgi:hypothetical protein